MGLKRFVKDKLLFLFLEGVVIACIATLLVILRLNTYTVGFIVFLLTGTAVGALSIEYLIKDKYYRGLLTHLKRLDKKYLLSEFAEEADFYEGNILRECLLETNKSMNDEIGRYRREEQDYREYIELWLHEVKTPVASAKLILENNPSGITSSIEEEIEKIEGYLDQALFYARSRSVERDYLLQRISLKEVVQTALKKNAKMLIREKVSVKIEGEDSDVYADKKWTDFILTQIIVNAAKYRTEHAEIVFSSEEFRNGTALYIKDNGIGINEKDLPRVFERGFTGKSGRKYAKSTGMGLYLCKVLCEKTGLSISISSEEGEGTKA